MFGKFDQEIKCKLIWRYTSETWVKSPWWTIFTDNQVLEDFSLPWNDIQMLVYGASLKFSRIEDQIMLKSNCFKGSTAALGDLIHTSFTIQRLSYRLQIKYFKADWRGKWFHSNLAFSGSGRQWRVTGFFIHLGLTVLLNCFVCSFICIVKTARAFLIHRYGGESPGKENWNNCFVCFSFTFIFCLDLGKTTLFMILHFSKNYNLFKYSESFLPPITNFPYKNNQYPIIFANECFWQLIPNTPLCIFGAFLCNENHSIIAENLQKHWHKAHPHTPGFVNKIFTKAESTTASQEQTIEWHDSGLSDVGGSNLTCVMSSSDFSVSRLCYIC